jgi:hypothetical protein
MDTSWIEEFKKTEKKYKPFYKTAISEMTFIYYYINQQNELYKIKKQKQEIEKNKITRDELLYKIKTNSIDNNIKYKFHSIFKYNETSSNSENITTKTGVITDIVKVETMCFEDTIQQFQDLNTINIFFKQTKKNNWSRTIKARKKKKRNRTHHRH